MNFEATRIDPKVVWDVEKFGSTSRAFGHAARDSRKRDKIVIARSLMMVRPTMLKRVGAHRNHWKRVKNILGSSPGPGQMLNWEIAD